MRWNVRVFCKTTSTLIRIGILIKNKLVHLYKTQKQSKRIYVFRSKDSDIPCGDGDSDGTGTDNVVFLDLGAVFRRFNTLYTSHVHFWNLSFYSVMRVENLQSSSNNAVDF